ncbi:DNA-3-methyladenine glycosylase family protein [Aerobium aerolatum]|uniref:DNA-3-methyladenine glycosylase family protein n=1 Tax=Aerobium aerolatum TaxID=561088 RepID=UPI000B82BB06|nr:DNA-3-methyladenine glycosylase [Aquamicrobium aerolatum]
MRRIVGFDDIAEGLAELVVLDPRLVAVIEHAGDVPLRLDRPGFASLVSIVVSQQVSRASADSIMGRLVSLVAPLEASGVLSGGLDVLRSAGLSRPKQKTVLALAEAVVGGEIDLDHMTRIGADEAMARLTSLHGIGPWTAEVYLLFCAGHPDIFPAHDVALQSAVGHAFRIEPRPSAKALYALAESWAPWRGVAARLFWAYYRQMRGRDALPTTRAT